MNSAQTSALACHYEVAYEVARDLYDRKLISDDEFKEAANNYLKVSYELAEVRAKECAG